MRRATCETTASCMCVKGWGGWFMCACAPTWKVRHRLGSMQRERGFWFLFRVKALLLNCVGLLLRRVCVCVRLPAADP